MLRYFPSCSVPNFGQVIFPWSYPTCIISIHRWSDTTAIFFVRKLIEDHIRIRAAAEKLNRFGKIIYIEKIVNHPDYCNRTKHNDISMVKLTKPLTSSKWVQQATVVKYGANIPDNLPIDLIGWRKIDVSLYDIMARMKK